MDYECYEHLIDALSGEQIPSIARLDSLLATESLAIVETLLQLCYHARLVRNDHIWRQRASDRVETNECHQAHLHVVLVLGEHAQLAQNLRDVWQNELVRRLLSTANTTLRVLSIEERLHYLQADENATLVAHIRIA